MSQPPSFTIPKRGGGPRCDRPTARGICRSSERGFDAHSSERAREYQKPPCGARRFSGRFASGCGRGASAAVYVTSLPDNSSRNSSMLRTLTCGKGIAARQSKCVSFVTIYPALETIAQSTNLLSSGSAAISPKRNCASTRTARKIAAITSSDTAGDKYRASISAYSSSISVVTQSA